MGRIYLTVGAGDGNTRGDGIGRGGVFDMGRGGELATSCISCCSCVVKAARVVLMLFSETFCLSVSRDGVIGTLRHWLCLGGCPRAMTSGEQIFWRAGYGRRGRPIGWLSTRIVQGSIFKDPNLL